jgi:hypothetical protein
MAWEAVWASTVFAIYVTPFLLLGWIVKAAAGRWMGRKGLDGSDLPGHLGHIAKRRRFLLGSWRDD